jgi:transglutaminase-like putative cysteine protease
LVLLLGLAVVPHVFNIERGIAFFSLALVLYRTFAISHPGMLPGRLPLFLLTMAGVGNVLMHYPILFGREAGVALLVSMLALKLVEMRVRRDVHILVFIGYFVLITQFLYNEAGWLVVYVATLVILLTALLIDSQRMKSLFNPLAPLLLSSVMLLQAVPVTIALFLFFPRFSSPLWHLGSESSQAVTGISGEISPGSISGLSRSSEVAFRVDFSGEIPPAAKRYWRGPVFWHTDGSSWSAESDGVGEGATPSAITVTGQTKPLLYHVTMEPSSERWLYALELPLDKPPGARLTPDFQILRNSAPGRRLRYRLRSVTDYHTGPLTPQERKRGLQLPENITPRMIELVKGWRRNSRSDTQLLLNALDHFRRQEFYYTLYPPPLRQNPADQFLFESRRGFCEHYATSFTLLMRIAGIPTRLVGGYQGGEVNPVGDYLIVRQSDAHAWVEVWLPERGWRRVDPTAAVAPERIEQPLDPASISDVIGAPIRFIELDSGLFGDLLRQLRWGSDALNASWHRWVLGYSRERQHYLMRLLGLGSLHGPKLGYAMIAITMVTVAAMAVLLLRRNRERLDPVQRRYLEFCRRLARRGIGRLPNEGPKAYADRVIALRPDLTASVAAISGLYIGIRYGRQDSPGNRARFMRLVRRFRP